MYKFKVEIEIDEEKVLQEGEYNLEKIYEYIRSLYLQYQLKEIMSNKSNQFIFVDRGNKKDLGGLGRATFDLCYTNWFLRYCTKCVWTDYGDDGTSLPQNVLKDFSGKHNFC